MKKMMLAAAASLDTPKNKSIRPAFVEKWSAAMTPIAGPQE
jgi:hypothetical protein